MCVCEHVRCHILKILYLTKSRACLCNCVYLKIGFCVSVCVSVALSVSLILALSVSSSVSICATVCVCVCMSVGLSVWLAVCVKLSQCLCLRMSLCRFVSILYVLICVSLFHLKHDYFSNWTIRKHLSQKIIVSVCLTVLGPLYLLKPVCVCVCVSVGVSVSLILTWSMYLSVSIYVAVCVD